jgi:phage/plasmid primase-like uncharacterized protein
MNAITERARAVRIEDELARRGLPFWTKARNNNLGQPCPMCGGNDRFSVNIRKQVFNCRGCGAAGNVIALVEALDGVGYLDAIATLAGEAPHNNKVPPANDREHIDTTATNNRAIALRLWVQATDPRRTLVERYLNGRCLDLPPEASNDAIRFHEHCPFGSEHYPAMICLVRQ